MTQLGVAMDDPHRDPLGDLKWKLAQELLGNGQNVLIESGHWMLARRATSSDCARVRWVAASRGKIMRSHARNCIAG